jgi:hypothetical protein
MSAFRTSLFAASLVCAFGAVAAPVMALDTTFFAVLLGGNEVSATGDANAGDPDGYGAASIVFKSNTELCYSLTAVGIRRPTSAHIHEAPAGVVAPPLVPLNPPSTGNPGVSSDCISVDREIGRRIRTNPSGFYVNIHNKPFPDGAIRGQLF